MRCDTKILKVLFSAICCAAFTASELRAEASGNCAQAKASAQFSVAAARRHPPKKKPKPRVPKKAVSKLSISAYCSKVDETFFPERLIEARCFSPLSDQFSQGLFDLITQLSG